MKSITRVTAKRIFVGYGGGGIATIDPTMRTKIADFPLPAHPEGFQVDRRNNQIVVNVPRARAMQMGRRISKIGSSSSLTCVVVIGVAMAGSTPSFAYRPFDGTDAAVADPQEVEIELAAAGVLRQDAQTSLIAPFMIFNYGFAKNWELVFQGQGQFPLTHSGESAGINGVGAFLKGILREGSLQDASGPSIAVEFGPLLPGLHADSGFGASFGTIVSQRWDWGTVHANVVTELTRDNRADFFVGGIIEGPSKWKVRPVAEFFYEEEIGQSRTLSALIGAIWLVKDSLSFDVGFRHAVLNGHLVEEFRAGMTFGFSLPEIKGKRRA